MKRAFLLALLLAPAAAAGTSVTRGPYLMMATPEAMTVRWRTSDSTDSRVWLGPSPGTLAPTASSSARTTEHELRVSGLSAGTRYYYAVGTTGQALAGDDTLTWFRTAPLPGGTMRVWVIGDSGKPGYRQDAVRDAYYAFPGASATDAWLMLGDNAYNEGTDDEYQAGAFVPYASFLRTHPLWPTRGNHDVLYPGSDDDYYDFFTMPGRGEAGGVPSDTEAWYAFDCGDVHFISLDSEGADPVPGSPMLTWLAADLAAADRSWIVAFWHRPPYSKGSHDSDTDTRMTQLRENVMPILEAGGVDLVLNGHSHGYERSYLIDGHYGLSSTFVPSMQKDAGDGRPDGDGPYHKPIGHEAHAGEVMVVAGTASQDAAGPLDHPAMVTGYNGLGSVVLDVSPSMLRGRFLDDAGHVRDDFEILKGVPAGGPTMSLALASANPARGQVAFVASGGDRLSIFDAAGRLVRRLDIRSGAATWDPQGAVAGVYFAVLERGSARRVAKVVLVP